MKRPDVVLLRRRQFAEAVVNGFKQFRRYQQVSQSSISLLGVLPSDNESANELYVNFVVGSGLITLVILQSSLAQHSFHHAHAQLCQRWIDEVFTLNRLETRT